MKRVLAFIVLVPLLAACTSFTAPVIDTHPLGRHRRKIADRVIFDKLLQVLVLGAA